MNTSIYDTTTSLAGSSVTIEAFNYNGTLSSLAFVAFNYMDAIVNGGAIALNGGLSYFGYYAMAQGFAAGEEIGAQGQLRGRLELGQPRQQLHLSQEQPDRQCIRWRLVGSPATAANPAASLGSRSPTIPT